MIILKKLVLRILAFALDLGLASLIIYGLTMLTFINPNIDELNREYKAYYRESEKVNNLNIAIDVYFEDEILSEDEEHDILSFYNNYQDCFSDVKVGEKATVGDVNRVKENVSKKVIDLNNERIIRINKLKYREIIVSLIVYVSYFGVLQYLLGGETPFKRLFRIKVVNKDDVHKKVSLFSFIIRSLLITEIVISLTDTALLFNLGSNPYITVNYWITQIKYIYEMAFLVCMVVRDDTRSIHDLILNTRVLRYDKDGHEIIEQLFRDNDEENITQSN